MNERDGIYMPVWRAPLTPWLACAYPERPYEYGATEFHLREDCHACAVAADAAYHHADVELRALFEMCWRVTRSTLEST